MASGVLDTPWFKELQRTDPERAASILAALGDEPAQPPTRSTMERLGRAGRIGAQEFGMGVLADPVAVPLDLAGVALANPPPALRGTAAARFGLEGPPAPAGESILDRSPLELARGAGPLLRSGAQAFRNRVQGALERGGAYDPGLTPETTAERLAARAGRGAGFGIGAAAFAPAAAAVPTIAATTGGNVGAGVLEETRWGQEHPLLAEIAGQLGGGLAGVGMAAVPRMARAGRASRAAAPAAGGEGEVAVPPGPAAPEPSVEGPAAPIPPPEATPAGPPPSQAQLEFERALGREGPAEGYAGNIGLSKYEVPDVLRMLMANDEVLREKPGAWQAAAQAEHLNAARREGRPWEQTEAAAKELLAAEDARMELARLAGVPPGQVRLFDWEKGKAFNAEQLEATRVLTSETGLRVIAAGARVRRALETRDEAAVRAAEGELAQALVALDDIREVLTGATAESGRTQNILRKATRARDQAARIAAVVDDLGGSPRMRDIAEALAEPGLSAGDVGRIAQAATRWGKFMELRTMMLLTSPRTHFANIGSNLLFQGLDVAEGAAAAAIDTFRPWAKDKVYWREIAAEITSAPDALVDAWQAMKNAWGTGRGGYAFGKLDVEPYAPQIGGRIGSAVRTPGRALVAEDEFFKGFAVKRKLYGLATHKALMERPKTRAELQELIERYRTNPTDDMVRQAQKEAKRLTFTADLEGNLAALGKMIRSSQGPGSKFFHLLIPFYRAPLNIAREGTKRFAPLAWATRENRELLGIAKGSKGLLQGKGSAEASRMMGRLAVGTAFGAGILAMATDKDEDGFPRMTGAYPVDEAARNAWQLAGIIPYAWRVGDHYVSYSRMEPIASVFGAYADFAQLNQYMDENENTKVAALLTLAFANNFMNKTFMQTFAEAAGAVHDPQMNLDSFVQNISASLATTVTGGAGVAAVAGAMDPYAREAHTVLDAVRKRIPIAREGLPHRINIVGEEAKVGTGGFAERLASPVYRSEINRDPLAIEILRVGARISKPKKDITPFPGKEFDVRLSPEDYEAYSIDLGKRAADKLRGLSREIDLDREKDRIEQKVNEAREQIRERWKSKLRPQVRANEYPGQRQYPPEPRMAQ